MAMMYSELAYSIASESEFNLLAEGKKPGPAYPWPPRRATLRIGSGNVGVVWRAIPSDPEGARPLVVVVPQEDQRRLFARFAQLRSDLSPLSTWCHIVTPDLFNRMQESWLEANLGGYEAAWAGLAVAEASILAGRPVSHLKLVACLATQSFAVARTAALWGDVPPSEILSRYDDLQRAVRTNGTQVTRVRKALEPIWSILNSVSIGGRMSSPEELLIVEAIQALRRARAAKDDEHLALRVTLEQLPESSIFDRLETLSAEQRLKKFDSLLQLIPASHEYPARRLQLAFLAGYISTIAAGGEASLSIAEDAATQFPEVTAFAYVLGGVGETITWSSGFEGLGRLVARELTRSFTFVDPPSCDFSSDEALVLIDKTLSDPLVHLRLKQSRVATAALYPGVNLQVPFAEQQPSEVRPPRNEGRPSSSGGSRASTDALAVIADALIPYIIDRLSATDGAIETEESRGGKSRWNRKSGQRKLPLR